MAVSAVSVAMNGATVGAKQFVDSRDDLKDMTIGLLSRCTGANAQYELSTVTLNLYRGSLYAQSLGGLDDSFDDDLCEATRCRRFHGRNGFSAKNHVRLHQRRNEPQFFAPSVTMPVLMTQVKDDAWTDNPADGQKTFDMLGSTDKELFWIEGTTRRFDG